ncbi:MAG: DUF4406 domain-containing protein [Phycisphaerales bacterium]|nr:DUF4406 domain-containing protein [Phycisphaerales bacterium]
MPEHNFPAFFAAEERLRQAGFEPLNPARNFDGETDRERAEYMRADMELLLRCDGLLMLPGWEESRGAKLEYMIAWELGLPILDIATLAEIRQPPTPWVQLHTLGIAEPAAAPESVLAEAARVTSGERQKDYGHPRDDFSRTAVMWNGLLASKLRSPITAMDVPLCMIAVKLAREAHRHKRDNLVDIAGYARTGAMVAGDE